MTSTLDRFPTRSDAPPPPSDGPRRWTRPVSVVALLVATGALYLWNLAASGWANSFYAAAVQAGANDWTAFFFGSLDPENAITKPTRTTGAPGAEDRKRRGSTLRRHLPHARANSTRTHTGHGQTFSSYRAAASSSVYVDSGV
ncbi:hypothetical protein [Pseudonocardia sp. EV170527-09]|uniref:hypothetical protein n=1 Tax=Pseudonocardia sp. EV170527-09 TaxID=2603411 RepID=UPI00351A6D02